MRFGLNVGYSGARMSLNMALIKEADRLGFHSVWTAEAYGSDAVTPLAWIAGADRADQRRHRHHADAGAHAGDDGDDRDDARPALGRPLPPRPRRLGAAGGRGLARRAVRQAAEAHARVHRDRAHRSGRARSRSSTTASTTRSPTAAPDATGLGKPLKSILHGRQIPIYVAAIGPQSVAQAAEIADGWLPIFCSPYARAEGVSRTSLEAGFEKAGSGKGLHRLRHRRRRRP